MLSLAVQPNTMITMLMLVKHAHPTLQPVYNGLTTRSISLPASQATLLMPWIMCAIKHAHLLKYMTMMNKSVSHALPTVRLAKQTLIIPGQSQLLPLATLPITTTRSATRLVQQARLMIHPRKLAFLAPTVAQPALSMLKESWQLSQQRLATSLTSTMESATRIAPQHSTMITRQWNALTAQSAQPHAIRTMT